MKYLLVVVGPIGSGKTTLCNALAAKCSSHRAFQVCRVLTGRHNNSAWKDIHKMSAMSNELKQHYIWCVLVKDFIEACVCHDVTEPTGNQVVILDRCPLEVTQVFNKHLQVQSQHMSAMTDELMQMLSGLPHTKTILICLNVPNDVMLERITQRGERASTVTWSRERYEDINSRYQADFIPVAKHYFDVVLELANDRAATVDLLVESVFRVLSCQ